MTKTKKVEKNEVLKDGLDQQFIAKDSTIVKLREFLKPSDTWELKKRGSKLTIVSHEAVQKIADKAGISANVKYRILIEPHVNNNHTIVVEATVTDDLLRSTNECGESNRSNLGAKGRTNPFNMAQKRAYDRAVFRHLGISGLLGEDELPDEEEKNNDKYPMFENLNDDQKKQIVPVWNKLLGSKTPAELNKIGTEIKKMSKMLNSDQLEHLRNQFRKQYKKLSEPRKKLF